MLNARQAFDTELAELSNALIRMGAAASNAIERAMAALCTGDLTLAKQVVEDDQEINVMERDIEQTCLRLLLRQQPVAGDLRNIGAAMKMITDIERIGDAAADIAEISLHLTGPILPEFQQDMQRMADAASDMVSSAIRAYVKADVALARSTRAKDDIVDEYFCKIRERLGEKIRTDVGLMDTIMDYLMVIKYLERVGDHAENLCEWVEFNETGVHGD